MPFSRTENHLPFWILSSVPLQVAGALGTLPDPTLPTIHTHSAPSRLPLCKV